MKNFRRFLSRMEKAIPLLVMGLLALISFVALKASPSYNTPDQAPSQSVFDYSLQHFSSAQLNTSGELVSLIKGRYATHSATQRITVIDDMSFTSSQAKARYIGHANQATIDDDNNYFTLLGKATIERSSTHADPQDAKRHLRITGEHFYISQYPERLTAQLPIYLEQGNRMIWADAMRYDGDEQQISFQGNVKIKVMPSAP